MFLELWNRLESRIHGRRVDHEVDAELQFHLEMQTEKNIAAGLPPVEARRQARLALGGAEQVKEACRDTRQTWLDSIWQDTRYALRTFRRDRVFTLTTVLTLAVGIGATTSTYSIVDGTLFKALPYDRPDRVVMLMQGDARSSELSETFGHEEARALFHGRSFAAVASYWLWAQVVTARGEEQPEAVRVAGVSSGFLKVLGIQPFLGRDFAPEDGGHGSAPGVMLTFGYWQRRFGGDPSILGKTIVLESRPLKFSGVAQVVGVLPGRFWYPRSSVRSQPDLLLADPVDWGESRSSGGRYFLLGRVRDEVTLREAQAECDTIAAGLQHIADAAAGPGKTKLHIAVRPLRTQMVAYWHDTLLTIPGAVLFLLLIACVNVANLMLARGRSRGRELAIRSSLGAGRGRIVRQLLTESALLGLAGGAIGVMVSWWTLELLVAQLQEQMQLVREIAVDGRVLSFAAAVTLASVTVFGGVPALASSRRDLMASLTIGPRLRLFHHAGRTGGRLLAVEVALALVLLVGAGLLVKSFVRLQRINVGFDPANVIAASINAPKPPYETEQHAALFFEQAADRVGSIPGVRSVATADVAPFSGAAFGSAISIDGQAHGPGLVDAYRVGAGYFETLGLGVVKGRVLTRTDDRATPLAAVVNEAMAKRYWGTDSPIGRNVIVGKDTLARIVGVVRDARSNYQAPPKPTIYVAYDAAYRRFRYRTLIVRTVPGREDLKKAIAAALIGLDPAQEPRPSAITDWVNRLTTAPRFYALVYSSFAGFGWLLAIVGIAGVAAQRVARRTHEIGVRLALGARRGRVVAMIARQTLLPISAGCLVGFAAAWMLTQTLRSLLFDIEPHDAATFVTVAVVFAVVALVATWLPARKAGAVDPIEVLRAE